MHCINTEDPNQPEQPGNSLIRVLCLTFLFEVQVMLHTEVTYTYFERYRFCVDLYRRYETFVMLNSAEHEIYPAHKCQNANNYCHFNLSERENIAFSAYLSWQKAGILYFYTYKYSKFHAQLS